jgi:hypothetical protein
MARIEHERWLSERRRNGWKYAPGQKNIKERTSPYLISWDRLSEQIRELDRNTVRELPSFLYKADFQICRGHDHEAAAAVPDPPGGGGGGPGDDGEKEP